MTTTTMMMIVVRMKEDGARSGNNGEALRITKIGGNNIVAEKFIPFKLWQSKKSLPEGALLLKISCLNRWNDISNHGDERIGINCH